MKIKKIKLIEQAARENKVFNKKLERYSLARFLRPANDLNGLINDHWCLSLRLQACFKTCFFI